MLRVRHFAASTSGAAAIEFALLSPLFLLLLVGMLNLGSQAFTQARLNQAVRETAEAALFAQDSAALRTVLRAALADIGVSTTTTPDAMSVELKCLCPGSNPITDCTATQAASCAATGLPWELVFEIRAKIPFTPPLPVLNYGRKDLTSELRVQLR